MAANQSDDNTEETTTISITFEEPNEFVESSETPDVGRCETVMDLSMKKIRNEPVLVELIVEKPFDGNDIVGIDGGDMFISKLRETERAGDHGGRSSKRSRSKKRKRPPQKCTQEFDSDDYVIETSLQQSGQPEDGVVNRDHDVIVSAKQAINGHSEGLNDEDKKLSLSVVASETVMSSLSSQISASIFASSLVTANGKSVRPFKLYTAHNRDLLAGLTVNTNMNTIAAALSGLPVSGVPVSNTNNSSGILGAAGAASLTIPTVSANPLIPLTIPTGISSSSILTVANNTPILSVPTSVITATSSSSAMRLMTLATEADKILREKSSPETTNSKFNKDSNKLQPILLTNVDPSGKPVTAEFNEDGTFNLTVDSNTSAENLTIIHERATAAVQAVLQQQGEKSDSDDQSEPKLKRRRGSLPEDLKNTAYWERRRKNNEAAKRSRDARRAKEDQIAIRAALLEQENVGLRIEIASLKEEVRELRAVICNDKKKNGEETKVTSES